MRTESNKGNWCLYKPNLFCQEGFCQDCEIYLSRQLGTYDRQTQKELDHLKAMREAGIKSDNIC